MSSRAKFAFVLAGVSLAFAGAVAAVLIVLWSKLAPEHQALLAAARGESIGPLILVSALLVSLLALALHALFRGYVLEPRRVADEIRLLLDANPDHRIVSTGPAEITELASAINALADRCSELRRHVDQRVATAGGVLERENSRLATVMSQLSESVIVCNTAGTILFYNHRARWVLENSPTGEVSSEPGTDVVGLGRSLFGMLGIDAVTHARDQILRRLQDGDPNPVSVFVARTRGGRLLRARMAPLTVTGSVTDGGPELWGYVLVLENIGRESKVAGLREQLLASLIESVRASLASMRAAAENLLQHPQMDEEQRRQFLQVIAAEAGKLGDRLERAALDQPGREWALPVMGAKELVLALQHALEDKLDITVTSGGVDEPLRIRADSFLLARAFSGFAYRLREACGVRALELHLERDGARLRLDLFWRGALPDTEAALRWINEPPDADRYPDAPSVRAAVDHHGGEVWYMPDSVSRTAYVRVLFAVAHEDIHGGLPADIPSRPIFHDFDLFHQAGQTPELDDRPLADLIYTVFDTETTGLEPSRGDQIISIGAVRIVNGRLLAGEVFDQLVDPQRSLPAASVKIHGITAEMLEGQPPIERVLPAFQQFCEDTVLVAHNAAFDMRFLQLNEERTGTRFTNAVLDTMLLSCVLHPDRTDHSLEALAARYGVAIEGRHTALGDAIAAGSIFVKMLPLLEQNGICTLGQARAAAQRTPYARVRY